MTRISRRIPLLVGAVAAIGACFVQAGPARVSAAAPRCCFIYTATASGTASWNYGPPFYDNDWGQLHGTYTRKWKWQTQAIGHSAFIGSDPVRAILSLEQGVETELLIEDDKVQELDAEPPPDGTLKPVTCRPSPRNFVRSLHKVPVVGSVLQSGPGTGNHVQRFGTMPSPTCHIDATDSSTPNEDFVANSYAGGGLDIPPPAYKTLASPDNRLHTVKCSQRAYGPLPGYGTNTFKGWVEWSVSLRYEPPNAAKKTWAAISSGVGKTKASAPSEAGVVDKDPGAPFPDGLPGDTCLYH